MIFFKTRSSLCFVQVLSGFNIFLSQKCNKYNLHHFLFSLNSPMNAYTVHRLEWLFLEVKLYFWVQKQLLHDLHFYSYSVKFMSLERDTGERERHGERQREREELSFIKQAIMVSTSEVRRHQNLSRFVQESQEFLNYKQSHQYAPFSNSLHSYTTIYWTVEDFKSP